MGGGGGPKIGGELGRAWEGTKKAFSSTDNFLNAAGDVAATYSTMGAYVPAKATSDKYGNDKRRKLEGDAANEQAKTDAIIQDMKNQELVSNETKKRDEARARQRMLAASQGGRAGTLLTSPLGVTDSFSSGRKTLLGE